MSQDRLICSQHLYRNFSGSIVRPHLKLGNTERFSGLAYLNLDYTENFVFDSSDILFKK